MTFTIEIDRLSEMLIASAQNGARIALQEAGIVKDTITLAEVKKLHKGAFAKAARISTKIAWRPIGKGSLTSGVYCLRSELERFRIEQKFSFNK